MPFPVWCRRWPHRRPWRARRPRGCCPPIHPAPQSLSENDGRAAGPWAGRGLRPRRRVNAASTPSSRPVEGAAGVADWVLVLAAEALWLRNQPTTAGVGRSAPRRRPLPAGTGEDQGPDRRAGQSAPKPRGDRGCRGEVPTGWFKASASVQTGSHRACAPGGPVSTPPTTTVTATGNGWPQAFHGTPWIRARARTHGYRAAIASARSAAANRAAAGPAPVWRRTPFAARRVASLNRVSGSSAPVAAASSSAVRA